MGEHLLEISDTAIFNGKLADGIAGVHSTVCLSFDKDKVPSWFLYVTEALSGGLDMMWLLSLKEADRKDGVCVPLYEIVIGTRNNVRSESELQPPTTSVQLPTSNATREHSKRI